MKRKRMWRKAIPLLVVAVMLFCPGGGFAAENGTEVSATGGYIVKTVTDPSIGSIGGEWAILGLAQSGCEVPAGYFENYYARVEAETKEKQGELHRVKYTEYSRLILALTAIGKDVTDVAGYNLLTKLADYDTLIKQGVNGPVFALLALDSHEYEIPAIASADAQASRERLIQYILQKEYQGTDGSRGGFALGDNPPDPDVTAMALQALAGYRERPEVAGVIARGLDCLSAMQLAGGGFSSKGEENAESAAQVLMALSILGIDGGNDPRFTKTDGSLYDALQGFRTTEGAYRHLREGEINGMATEQAFCAMVAYERMKDGKSSIYDLNDVSILPSGIQVLIDGKAVVFDQPPIIESSRTLVPMRAIFEALGAEVFWDNQARKVTGMMEEKKIELTIGEKTAYVDGEVKTLDVSAKIVNGRTLVPVRFVAESTGAKVEWKQAEKCVIITTEKEGSKNDESK